MSVLYRAVLPRACISFIIFWVVRTVPCEKSHSFTYSFPRHVPFISFFFLIALVTPTLTVFRGILSIRGGWRYLCLSADLRSKTPALGHPLLSPTLAVTFHNLSNRRRLLLLLGCFFF